MLRLSISIIAVETDSTVVEAIPTPALCRLAGVKRQTLDHWVKSGLVTASFRGSEGRRRTRWWSINDVVVVRAVRTLREAGCPLQQVKKAKALLDGAGISMSQALLYWDGKDVLSVEEWGTVRSMVRRPGQQVLHVVALPLRHWFAEARSKAIPLDVSEFSVVTSSRPRRGYVAYSEGAEAAVLRGSRGAGHPPMRGEVGV
jgi:DNA-binding transcriptional MerR regulator